MSRTLRILNWGHRRATAPIAAARLELNQRYPEIDLEIDIQPLSGFESAMSARIVDSFDLVIFDHPFCGAIARDGLLRPYPESFGTLTDDDYVGRSLASYRYANALWAVPIDGATQTAIYRADLLAMFGAVPRRFDDVLKLGEQVRTAGKFLGLACLNPHGFLVLSAFCASLGEPIATDPHADPFSRPVMREALKALRAVIALSRPGSAQMNAIDLHDAMSQGDDIVYCPAAYAYLTYAEDDIKRRLSFGAFPGLDTESPAGTILGGTGLGITRGCKDLEAAESFARMLAQGDTQTRLIAMNHGQAGHASAWEDPDIDRRFNGALTAIRSTIETAIIRPRYQHAIPFQHACGAIIERFCDGAVDATAAIEAMWQEWRTRLPT